MKKQEFDRLERYERLYHKALNGGNEMLDHAYRLDKLADENTDLEAAIQQRTVAYMLREYYKKMFN